MSTKQPNDALHGDEHLTDEPTKFLVTGSEIVRYQIEVEAMSEDEAISKAYSAIKDDTGEAYISNDSFQIDSVRELKDQLNFNYSYGGSD